MVRRATLERGQPTAADDTAADDEALPGPPAPSSRLLGPLAGQRQSRQNRGSGGRWLVWLGRGVAWTLLLLIGYRGVTAMVTGPPATTAVRTSAVPANSGFPATLAEAYALQFGNVYLNYSPATATQRRNALAAFLPPGSDSQLGWNGAGSQNLKSEQVARIQVQNPHQAMVTLLALVNGGHLLELGVPVYSSGGGLIISGEPAFLSAPARAAPPQSAAVSTDDAAQTALLNQLPAFFQAFASGNKVTLARFLAPGAQVTGLGNAVTFSSISQLNVPSGGPTRHITAVVVWRVPPAQGSAAASSVAAARASLEMTYDMTVIRRGGSWYVESIGTSGQLPGPP